MSRYFQTLNRLQAGTRRVADVGAKPELDLVEAVPAVNAESHRITLKPAESLGALAGLLDGLRLISSSRSGRCVVLAGVSSDTAAGFVQRGLEAEAVRSSVNLVTGRLIRSRGRRFVVEFSSTEDSVAIDLETDAVADALRARIQKVDPEADVAVLQGPPLSDSVDAALLARSTSGLILVLEPLVTRRSDLFLALERAERSGCEVLGVVTLDARKRLPQWLRRLIERSGQ